MVPRPERLRQQVARAMTRFSACCWLLVFFSNGFAAGLDRIQPISSAKPSDALYVQDFNALYESRIRHVLATEAVADDGELAQEIFLECRSRRDNPEFVAYGLDKVAYLASISPRHQSLAYTAIQTQARSGLRPKEACWQIMMQLGPRVLSSMDAEDAEPWLKNIWLGDAFELAEIYVEQERFLDAQSVLAAVRDAANACRLRVTEPLLENEAWLQTLAVLNPEQSNRTPTDGREQILAGIVTLVRTRDTKKASDYLLASGDDAAVRLGSLLKRYGDAPDKPHLGASIVTAASEIHMPRVIRHMFDRSLAATVECGLDRVAAPTFFGISQGNASRIVFVVDRSGSMRQKLDMTKKELKQAISGLPEGVLFQVVFFDTQAYEMPGGALLPATAEGKGLAEEFIDSIGSVGGTNPSTAMGNAFSFRPDTINLLTDGEFQEAVADVIADLNSEKKVKINTICFLSANGRPVLERIARENRGVFKSVDVPK